MPVHQFRVGGLKTNITDSVYESLYVVLMLHCNIDFNTVQHMCMQIGLLLIRRLVNSIETCTILII
jgi:hypothetical protein